MGERKVSALGRGDSKGQDVQRNGTTVILCWRQIGYGDEREGMRTARTSSGGVLMGYEWKQGDLEEALTFFQILT